MQKVPMTANGAEKLRQELTRLKQTERPKIITAIAEARAHGDLKENAEYHAAREQQGFIEGRILELESKLSMLQVIDVTSMENTGRVIFGATIKLENTQGHSLTYQIVGEEEADIGNNRISVTSPVARALIGKYEGDSVKVHTPDGVVVYDIIEVAYV
ncbi:MAG: transcription elongation factor GreA [Gammaproteobacteria bacterium RIFCSPHIGHO2_12_FULL_43_28]|nr:MAG: transcription elongation factor GreA [Gammaproteobacteria bacterium RIFCSPHIGHO2_12_FULL_43_28]